MITITHQLNDEPPPVAKPLKERMPRARRQAWWEQMYPWLGGVAVAIVAYLLDPSSKTVYDALKGCLDSAVDAAAILAGFQGTALTLLFSLLTTGPVQELRRRGVFEKLVSYHGQAILIMLIAVAIAMALLAIQGVRQDFGNWGREVCAVAAFVVASGSLATFRVTHLMIQILASKDIATTR